jgi:hypothetical protein
MVRVWRLKTSFAALWRQKDQEFNKCIACHIFNCFPYSILDTVNIQSLIRSNCAILHISIELSMQTLRRLPGFLPGARPRLSCARVATKARSDTNLTAGDVINLECTDLAFGGDVSNLRLFKKKTKTLSFYHSLTNSVALYYLILHRVYANLKVDLSSLFLALFLAKNSPPK